MGRRVIEVAALVKRPHSLLTPAMLLTVLRAYRKAMPPPRPEPVEVEAPLAA